MTDNDRLVVDANERLSREKSLRLVNLGKAKNESLFEFMLASMCRAEVASEYMELAYEVRESSLLYDDRLKFIVKGTKFFVFVSASRTMGKNLEK